MAKKIKRKPTHLTPEHHNELTKLSERYHVSIESLVRLAMHNFLKLQNKKNNLVYR